ncbi:glycosyltransferase family 2 protein [Candidatus Micrarchaeota archaeon]|nr:glycosyltransferase family 2 protein [Candidatus Micrarchaeota archaeon]MBU1930105.1 glycosyltransferase family 2 protein [Candidatus Micrarchaeota archaeon]
MVKKKRFSVIIPAYNEEKRIANCLNAFKLALQKNLSFEVLVVDDGSTDKTVEIASSFGFVKVLKASHKGAAAARNLGARKAQGEILVFTDADCIPDSDWLSVIANQFEKEPGLVCMEGKTYTDKTGLFEHAVSNQSGNGFQSCNLAIKKDVFFKAKGFDEQYVYFREDSDLAFALLEKKFKIAFVPKMKVFHPKRKISERAFFRELFLVRNDILLFKKFPTLYNQFFGFVCKGNFKQSIITWFLALLFVAGMLILTYNGQPESLLSAQGDNVDYSINFFPMTLFLVLLLVLFRFFVSMKGKTFSFSEGVRFLAITTLRDLLFPFFFVYYWFSTKKSF